VTGETARLVEGIRERARRVTSLVAEYQARLTLGLRPVEVTGKLSFLGPDKCRAETRIGGERITTVRRGRVVHRYVPKRGEVWKYSLDDLPQAEPINFGTADLRDPFFAVDEAGLRSEGMVDLDSRPTHVFVGRVRGGARHGVLDTRKGFRIRYRPRGLAVQVELHVDAETGLLRSMRGLDATGAELFSARYTIREVNVPLDESLFALEESAAAWRVIDMAETFLSSLNPDSADQPPSVN